MNPYEFETTLECRDNNGVLRGVVQRGRSGGCLLDGVAPSAPPDVPPRNPTMNRMNGRVTGNPNDLGVDFEPSCLVRTPSGNVYIPSGNLNINKSSPIDYKSGSACSTPTKETLKGYDRNCMGPVLPPRSVMGGMSTHHQYSAPMNFRKGIAARCSSRCIAIVAISIIVLLVVLLVLLTGFGVLTWSPSNPCTVLVGHDTEITAEKSTNTEANRSQNSSLRPKQGQPSTATVATSSASVSTAASSSSISSRSSSSISSNNSGGNKNLPFNIYQLSSHKDINERINYDSVKKMIELQQRRRYKRYRRNINDFSSSIVTLNMNNYENENLEKKFHNNKKRIPSANDDPIESILETFTSSSSYTSSDVPSIRNSNSVNLVDANVENNNNNNKYNINTVMATPVSTSTIETVEESSIGTFNPTFEFLLERPPTDTINGLSSPDNPLNSNLAGTVSGDGYGSGVQVMVNEENVDLGSSMSNDGSDDDSDENDGYNFSRLKNDGDVIGGRMKTVISSDYIQKAKNKMNDNNFNVLWDADGFNTNNDSILHYTSSIDDYTTTLEPNITSNITTTTTTTIINITNVTNESEGGLMLNDGNLIPYNSHDDVEVIKLQDNHLDNFNENFYKISNSSDKDEIEIKTLKPLTEQNHKKIKNTNIENEIIKD